MDYKPRRKLTREFKLEAVRQTALSENRMTQLKRLLRARGPGPNELPLRLRRTSGGVNSNAIALGGVYEISPLVYFGTHIATASGP